MSSSCWLSRYSSERKHSGEKSLHSWIALNRITRADRAESISPVWYGDSRVRRVLRNGQKKTFFHLSSSYNVCWTCWWRKWKGNSLASLLPGISFIKQRVNFRLPLLLDAHALFIYYSLKNPPPPWPIVPRLDIILLTLFRFACFAIPVRRDGPPFIVVSTTCVKSRVLYSAAAHIYRQQYGSG